MDLLISLTGLHSCRLGSRTLASLHAAPWCGLLNSGLCRRFLPLGLRQCFLRPVRLGIASLQSRICYSQRGLRPAFFLQSEEAALQRVLALRLFEHLSAAVQKPVRTHLGVLLQYAQHKVQTRTIPARKHVRHARRLHAYRLCQSPCRQFEVRHQLYDSSLYHFIHICNRSAFPFPYFCKPIRRTEYANPYHICKSIRKRLSNVTSVQHRDAVSTASLPPRPLFAGKASRLWDFTKINLPYIRIFSAKASPKSTNVTPECGLCLFTSVN